MASMSTQKSMFKIQYELRGCISFLFFCFILGQRPQITPSPTMTGKTFYPTMTPSTFSPTNTPTSSPKNVCEDDVPACKGYKNPEDIGAEGQI